MLVETNCRHCQKTFQALEKELKRGNGKFCSISCASKSRKRDKDFNATCAQCAMPFYAKTSRFDQTKSGLLFCSRACKEKAQKIGGIEAIQPTHYRGKQTPADYRAFFLRRGLLASCARCGFNAHPQILQIHHRDQDRKNNNLDNLEILCPNCHALEHWGSS